MRNCFFFLFFWRRQLGAGPSFQRMEKNKYSGEKGERREETWVIRKRATPKVCEVCLYMARNCVTSGAIVDGLAAERVPYAAYILHRAPNLFFFFFSARSGMNDHEHGIIWRHVKAICIHIAHSELCFT